jgi:hypothetical protein
MQRPTKQAEGFGALTALRHDESQTRQCGVLFRVNFQSQAVELDGLIGAAIGFKE